ncbi:serine/threonine-protein kinase [Brachybacterium sp. AOP42-E1-35]|uniref:serine/threonine-protein kinase n=1 Tax=Brachybacterium TaxID=43668 RepID=UPI003FD3307D
MAELLGHYRLHEVLGVGSFATVHRAHDERLDASVAVKVLAENHSLNPEIRERFIAEGRTLRRVGGPHLVTVHDIGQTSRQQPYLVLEIADRGTLRQRVENLRAEGWRATREDALALARPLAAAVGAVHRARLVHRDLSPGNLLLTSTGGVAGVTQGDAVTPPASVLGADERLLVADLGMCKDLAVSSGLTVAAGTDGFRPPEQSRPAVVDIRADIWAMSSVLRWLVQDADLPAALHRTLERGLQEDPGARQADATTWLGEVEEALALETAPAAHEPSAASPVGPEPSSASSLSASAGVGYRLRRRAVLGALLVLALVTGLGLGSRLDLRGAVPSAAGGVSLAIEGPDEVRVGEEAVFTAEVEGADSWVWSLPTGSHLVDAEQTVLTASGPGTAEVVLRARAPDGQELEARRTVRVLE